jgi:hypothetical protein
MAITDKSRKILWGRSGNRCAICRQKLVLNETDLDPESVVGDECHIISAAKTGPRHDPEYPRERFDEISNLILLCRVHHKMIDDQYETYSVSVLKNIKDNHEKWVEDKLKDDTPIKPIKIKRFKEEIPQKLTIIDSGKELFNLASGCHASYTDYSDDLLEDEFELIGHFFQNVQDWVDIATEPLDNLRAVKSIGDGIKDLKDRDFLVFAAVENQRIEGGELPPTAFKSLHLSVIRKSDPRVQFS